MAHLRSLSLPAGILLVTLIAFRSAEARAAPAPSDALDDSRLDQAVALTLEYRPIREALLSLERQTRVKLAASGQVADDKVTVMVRRRPAREVLVLLARHFGFRWSRKGDGFQLTQDLASRRREAAKRAAFQAERMAEIEKRMGRVAQLAGSAPEKLEELNREVTARLARADPEAGERRELAAERQAIADLTRSGGRICAGLWRSLRPAQRQQLGSAGELRLSTAGGSLGRDFTEQLREAQVESLASRGQDLPASVSMPTDTHVRIRLADEDGRTWGVGHADRGVRLLFDLANATERGDATFTRWRVEAAPRERRDPGELRTFDPALSQKVELPLAALKERGGAREHSIGPQRFATKQILVPLGGVAKALHVLTGLDIVVDGFIRARVDAAKITTAAGQPRRVGEILDATADAIDYDWLVDGGVVRLRSRTYFLDRPEEVPERLIGTIIEDVRGNVRARDVAGDLAGLGVIASSLTDTQLRGLRDYWKWYAQDSGLNDSQDAYLAFTYRAALRLCSALTPAQLRGALSGTAIQVRKMDSRQRQAFVSALLTPQEEVRALLWWTLPEDRAPTEVELAGGALSMSCELSTLPLRERQADGGVTTRPRYTVMFRYSLGGGQTRGVTLARY